MAAMHTSLAHEACRVSDQADGTPWLLLAAQGKVRLGPAERCRDPAFAHSLIHVLGRLVERIVLALGLQVRQNEELVDVRLISVVVLAPGAVRSATPVAFQAKHPVLGKVDVLRCNALGLGAHFD